MTAHSFYNPIVTGSPEEKQLAQQMAKTWPGQASFAESADKECRQCVHWEFNGYNGDRTLKQGKCKKAKALSCGRINAKFPGWAAACKYFEAGEDHPRHTGMEGDYRQVNGPDHLWRETRRSLREAEEKGHTIPTKRQT